MKAVRKLLNKSCAKNIDLEKVVWGRVALVYKDMTSVASAQESVFVLTIQIFYFLVVTRCINNLVNVRKTPCSGQIFRNTRL